MTDKEPKVWYSLGEIYGKMLLPKGPPTTPKDWRDLSDDSPLERQFARDLVPYLHPDTELETQVSVDTMCGRFRLDLVAHHGSSKVAFECDGKEYHDEGRDEWRDAMILGANAVDVIYRFRGRDLTYYVEDCLFLASQWEPDIFGPTGCLKLRNLASQQALNYVEHCTGDSHTFHLVSYATYTALDYLSPRHIFVVRNSVHVPSGVNPFWKALFQFAEERHGGNLDDLIKQWRERAQW